MTAELLIGFVGIGNMGAPMVRCLAKTGHQVTIFDTRAAACAPFLVAPATGPRHVTIADSLPALAAASNVVITMLPDSKIVRRAVMGADGAPGLIAHLKPDTIIIDMSSSYAPETVALGQALAAKSIGLIDAPVSGGVARAISGTLAIMTGGDPAAIARAAPVLTAMGTIHRTGRLGSGHAMKALNNYVSAAGLIAVSEALAIGQTFGLDGAVMGQVLNASTGRNNTTENKVDRYMLSGKFDSGFALALMSKDVGMAQDLAASLKVPAAGLDLAADLLRRAGTALGPDADHTALYKFINVAGAKTR